MSSDKELEEISRAYEEDVREYFACCPLCGNSELSINIILGGRDTLNCKNCNAEWHLYIGREGLKWAELEVESDDGNGEDLVGKRLNKQEWQRMARIANKKISLKQNENNQVTKEKEIIREKEIIVKLRCQYCKNLYNEIESKCPHCGARS